MAAGSSRADHATPQQKQQIAYNIATPQAPWLLDHPKAPLDAHDIHPAKRTDDLACTEVEESHYSEAHERAYGCEVAVDPDLLRGTAQGGDQHGGSSPSRARSHEVIALASKATASAGPMLKAEHAIATQTQHSL